MTVVGDGNVRGKERGDRDRDRDIGMHVQGIGTWGQTCMIFILHILGRLEKLVTSQQHKGR